MSSGQLTWLVLNDKWKYKYTLMRHGEAILLFVVLFVLFGKKKKKKNFLQKPYQFGRNGRQFSCKVVVAFCS